MGVKIGPNAAVINETTTSKTINSTTYSVVSSDFNSDKCALTLTLVHSGWATFTVTNSAGVYLLYEYDDESGIIAPGSTFKRGPMAYVRVILRNYQSLVGGGLLTSETSVREVA